jgi:hypothetical protein
LDFPISGWGRGSSPPVLPPSGGLGRVALAPLELQITVGRSKKMRVVEIDDFTVEPV